jgi:hypothetical protein
MQTRGKLGDRSKALKSKPFSYSWPETDGKRAREQRALKRVQLATGTKTLKGETPGTLGPERGPPGPGGENR